MHCLSFDCDISPETILSLATNLRRSDVPRNLYVNSPGGFFWGFVEVAPAIEMQDLTTVADQIASAAIIPYLLGKKRYALPSARFGFHLVGIEDRRLSMIERDVLLFGKSMDEEMLMWASLTQGWLLDLIAKRTGVSRGTFLRMMEHEVELTAEEALEYGIVHQILPAHAEESLILL